ncbi:MAG: hypothetical protein ACREN2_13765 [Candidatus Dormibacteria bacterium]
MGAHKGDLVRARTAGPDHAAVEGILNIRYRKAWNKVLVDVITSHGPMSVDPRSVEVIQAGKVTAESLEAIDPIGWEDGARYVRDLDTAIREDLIQRERAPA